MVYGRPRGGHGVIEVSLGRDRRDRKKISDSTASPRDATTEWEVVEEFPGLALVRARPRTGRTHQVAVGWWGQGHTHRRGGCWGVSDPPATRVCP